MSLGQNRAKNRASQTVFNASIKAAAALLIHQDSWQTMSEMYVFLVWTVVEKVSRKHMFEAYLHV